MNTDLGNGGKLPDSKTGVLNTNPRAEINLDYLSFTLSHSQENKRRIAEMLDLGEVEETGHGGMFYKNSASILDGGRMFWHEERREMGIHVRLNPGSLSMLKMTPVGLISRIMDYDGKITRIDIAFDDKSGLLDIDEMYQKILNGEVVTRWRKVQRITGQKTGDVRKTGDTVNYGARVSEAFLRMYNKKLEQAAKGTDMSTMDSWVRVELELKGKKAMAVAKELVKIPQGKSEWTEGEMLSRLLLGMVDFKEPSEGDDNKSRWRTSEFWSEFVGQNEKLFLRLPKSEKSIEKSKEWVRKAVGPTLAMIVLTTEDDSGENGYDFIMRAIFDGQARMTEMQQLMLDLYNAKMAAKDGEVVPEMA